jgi:hypothetical protein
MQTIGMHSESMTDIIVNEQRQAERMQKLEEIAQRE